MSTDYKTYIGPYIEVYNPLQTKINDFYGCINKTCKSCGTPQSYKFCPECGNEIQLIENHIKGRIEFDIHDETKDTLSEMLCGDKPVKISDYRFFIPNDYKAPGIIYDNKYDPFAYSVNEIIIKSDDADVSARYSGELLRLKEVFGEANVTIKWGVLGDIS